MKTAPLLLGPLLFVTACGAFDRSSHSGGGGEPGPGVIGPDPRIEDPDLVSKGTETLSGPIIEKGALRLHGGLKKAQSCDEATTGLRDVLLTQLRAQFDSQIRYFRPSDERVAWADDLSTVSAPMEAKADSAAGGASSAGPTDYTTTNNQVEGVEEGDFIKNTGTHMFIARYDRIFVVKSWPASDMSEKASLVIGDQIHEMLLVDGKTLVIAGSPRMVVPQPKVPGPVVDVADFSLEASLPFWAAYQPIFSWNSTAVTVVDVSQPESPKIVDRKHFKGSFTGFRRVGGSVRALLRSYLSYPEGVTTYLPYSEDYPKTQEELASRLQALYDEAKAKMSALSAEDFLDQSQWGYYRSYANAAASSYGDLGEPLSDVAGGEESCAKIRFPHVAPNQLSLTRIVTLDLEQKTYASDLILASADTIYSSKDSLYLAGQVWNWWYSYDQSAVPPGTPLEWTTLHKFDLTDPGRASYVASGVIPGRVLNQFSLDEREGVLRVATTENRIVEMEEGSESRPSWWWWDNQESVSSIATLEARDGQLTLLGRTPDLAKGERIYSARFSGTRGFIVTFRQVDPLFAVDLSNPATPTVLGELKIPGFSEYMQFIDEGTLLTIGRDADPETGRVRGLKLSLFDVSDMRHLKETHSHVIDHPGWTSSEANYEHKAFTYFARTGHLAIPLSHYNWASGSYRYENGLSLFKVDKQTGITPAGRVDLSDLAPALDESNISWVPSHLQVRRSVFADDFVYAISSGGVKVAPISNPSAALSSVALPCENCDQYYRYGRW